MNKKLILFLVSLFFSSCLFAQQAVIRIQAQNEAITNVLEQLREDYQLQLSYSENFLASYTVSINKTFSSPQQALKEVLKDLPFELKQADEVFIIVPLKKVATPEPPKERVARERVVQEKDITIAGQIVEAGTLEPLPFSTVQINEDVYVSNITGTIHFTIPMQEEPVQVKISQLGYHIYDTTLSASINQKFLLIPASFNIPEVLVTNSIIEKATQFGEELAKVKLNQNIAAYMPSQGDNAVFNVLRLMPGIQAGSEQTDEPLTWGGYEGQTQIIFDGFLLFGLKSYNDQISAVNPLLIKNIEVLKSGYNAKYSNQVSGLINITGRNGNFIKPSFTLNVNPTTLNAIAELPLRGKSSLLVAYRQTYYNIYNSDDFNIFGGTAFSPDSRDNRDAPTTNTDLSISPESYVFRDFNVKYSVNTAKGDLFYLSFYHGTDQFNLASEASVVLNPNKEDMLKNIALNDTVQIGLLSTEERRQYGFSTFFGKNWENGLSSNFLFSLSNFEKTEAESFGSEVNETSELPLINKSNLRNDAKEFTFKQENQWQYSPAGKLSFGAGFYMDQANYVKSLEQNQSSIIDTLNASSNKRIYIYAHNSWMPWHNLSIETGLHANYLPGKGTVYPEPRVRSSYQLTEALKVSVAWGMYQQYLYKQETVNEYNYYAKQWIASSGEQKPLRSIHYVAGLHYHKNNYTVNLEAYRKNTSNLSRIFYQPTENMDMPPELNSLREYQGEAKTYGMDFLLKKDWKNHTLWACYTLSKTLEKFEDAGMPQAEAFSLAPQDQRHEFKIAGLSNWGKWYFSANYVFGSGMQILKSTFPDKNVAYNRLDAATTYRFTTSHLKMETGIAILNILNTENLKYANLKSVNLGEQFGTLNIYTNAVPFTPTIFFKAQF